ncbi:MAG TPA: tetratricopeptide repeat protein, partial [Gemmataceae bacterium]|nr:tetratricopeptide repeat protein [Gemmataceae bacterium]
PEADACLARAEALAPDDPRWPYLRAYGARHDRDAAFAAAGRAVAVCRRTGKVEAGPYLFLAELCVERGDGEQARTLCRSVLDREPDNSRALLDLGLAALADNDPDGCVPPLLRAAEDLSLRRTACAALATAYQRGGDELAAADYARRARQAPPADPPTDEYVEAMQALMAGRQVKHRAVAKLEAQGRFNEAVALLRQLAADDPNDGYAFLRLGVLLNKAGDLAGAERALRRAVSLSPGAVEPQYFLAAALYYQGGRAEAAGDSAAAEKYRAAADAARRATEIAPDHAQALTLLGLSLKKLGRRKEAIESLRAARNCRPEEPEVHLALGDALAEDGQRDEAIVELQSAIDLAGPDDPRPRQALERLRAARPKSWLRP